MHYVLYIHLYRNGGNPTCHLTTSRRMQKEFQSINQAIYFSIDSGATRPAIWPHARECKRISINARVTSAFRNLPEVPIGSSKGTLRKFYDMAKSWLEKGKISSVRWIPSHISLKGNEITDTPKPKIS